MGGETMEQQTPRATRFPIPMPLRYREAGGETWQVGNVENISRTGVLFDVENALGVSGRIEMAFDLPVLQAGATPGQVYCEGQVVRTVLPVASDHSVAVAAQILHYKLLPATEPLR